MSNTEDEHEQNEAYMTSMSREIYQTRQRRSDTTRNIYGASWSFGCEALASRLSAQIFLQMRSRKSPGMSSRASPTKSMRVP